MMMSAGNKHGVTLRRPLAQASGRLEGWPQARCVLPSFETRARLRSGALLRMTAVFVCTLHFAGVDSLQRNPRAGQNRAGAGAVRVLDHQPLGEVTAERARGVDAH